MSKADTPNMLQKENAILRRRKACLNQKSFCTDPKGIEVRKYVYESVDQIYFFGPKANREEIEHYKWE